MPIILRPSGDTDLGNATIHDDAALPQTISGLAAGDWDVGRIVWATEPVTVQEASGPTGPVQSVLAIVAGQSNGQSQGTKNQPIPAKYSALGSTQIWVATAGAFQDYQPGINSDTRGGGPHSVFGPEAEFAHQIEANNPGTAVYVVKETPGGVGIAADPAQQDWDDDTGEIYGNMMNQVTGALAAMPAPPTHIVVIGVWGENDSRSDEKALGFEANLADMLGQMKLDIPGARIILTRLRPAEWEGAVNYARSLTIRQAMSTVSLGDPDIGLIDGDFPSTTDFAELHPAPDWVEGVGLRAYTLVFGDYPATYGDIYDTVPDPFDFTDLTDQTPDAMIASARITPTGFERDAPISVIDGQYRIEHATGETAVPWTSTPGTISKYQRVQVRKRTPASNSTSTSVDLDIGGVIGRFTITTVAAGGSAEPTFVGMGANIYTIDPTTTVALPSGIQAGDQLFVVAQGNVPIDEISAAGWTSLGLVSSSGTTGGSAAQSLLTKVAVAGEPDPVVTKRESLQYLRSFAVRGGSAPIAAGGSQDALSASGGLACPTIAGATGNSLVIYSLLAAARNGTMVSGDPGLTGFVAAYDANQPDNPRTYGLLAYGIQPALGDAGDTFFADYTLETRWAGHTIVIPPA